MSQMFIRKQYGPLIAPEPFAPLPSFDSDAPMRPHNPE